MSEISAYNDKIYIRDLSIRCIIGVNQEERTEKQDVIINIILLPIPGRQGKLMTWMIQLIIKRLKKLFFPWLKIRSFC